MVPYGGYPIKGTPYKGDPVCRIGNVELGDMELAWDTKEECGCGGGMRRGMRNEDADAHGDADGGVHMGR